MSPWEKFYPLLCAILCMFLHSMGSISINLNALGLDANLLSYDSVRERPLPGPKNRHDSRGGKSQEEL